MKFIKITSVLLLFFSFLSLINSAFGVQDDFLFYEETHLTDIWSSSFQNAIDQGRFFQTFIMPLFFKLIPYGFKSLTYASALNLLLWAMDAVMIAVIIKRLLKNDAAFVLLVLFYAATVNVVGHYSPLTSYPVYFSFSVGLFLIALWLLLEYKENQQRKYLLWSVICYAFFILFCEMHILYLPLILFLVWDETKVWWKQMTNRTFVPFLIVTLGYLIVYVAWSKLMGNNDYTGNKVASNLSIMDILKSVWAYTKPAAPLNFFHTDKGYLIANSYLPEGHKQNIGYIIFHAKWIWLLKASVIAALAYITCNKFKDSTLPSLKYIVFFLVVYLFVPNVLISVTPKYIDWSSWENYYVYTFYTYLTIVPILTIVFLYLIFVLSKTYMKTIAIVLVSLTLFVVSTVNDYLNDHALRSIQKSENILEGIQQWYTSEEFKKLPDGSTVEATVLMQPFSDVLYFAFDESNLEKYTLIHSGKSLKFIRQDTLATKELSASYTIQLDTMNHRPVISLEYIK